jgi:predicted MarR family transcription regulator
VPNLGKKRNSVACLVYDTHLTEPYRVSQALASYFQSVYYKKYSSWDCFCSHISFDTSSLDNTILFAVKDADVLEVTKRFKTFKSVWPDDTSGSIIKGYADIFVP